MKLDYKKTVRIGLAFMSICAFWQVYDGIIPLVLKNTFDMSDTLSGFIMALDNILALFLLPYFGNLSDKTRSPLGKRMPYIVVGTVLACIGIIALPFFVASGNLIMFLVCLGVILLAMSFYRSPAVALMPDLTPKPLRSRGNAVINLMGAIGGLFSLLAIGVLVPKGENPSYIKVFLFIAALMAVCVAVLVLTVNEKRLAVKHDDESEEAASGGAGLTAEQRRSLVLILVSVFLWYMGYNAVTTSFSKYANVYWGLSGGDFAYALLIAQAAAIISYIPAGMAAARFGRKKTVLTGVISLTAAFACCALFKTFSSLIFLFFVMAGVGWASINVNSYPMVVEMSRGSDIGKFTGLYYTFSMLAQIITPILSGAVLEFCGYVYLFPYGALFAGLSFVSMLFVRHGDAKAQMPENKIDIYEEI